MTSRRGFTLVELMIGLVLTLMVSGVTYRVLNTNQRLSRAQVERADLQDNVRSGTLVMANELREIGYDSVPSALPAGHALVGLLALSSRKSDIVAMGPDSIVYNSMRGFGVTCAKDGTNGRLTLRNTGGLLQLLRAPVVNSDRVVVYIEGDPSIQADDLWLHGTITGYNANQNCPDGTAGSSITIALDNGLAAISTSTAFGALTVGGPVRIYEKMLMRSYTSGGQVWLGMKSVSGAGTIQPVIGPLSADAGSGANAVTGLGLKFFDVSNNETPTPANVRSIQVTLRGISDGTIRKNGTAYAAVDTLQTVSQVALRNTLR